MWQRAGQQKSERSTNGLSASAGCYLREVAYECLNTFVSPMQKQEISSSSILKPRWWQLWLKALTLGVGSPYLCSCLRSRHLTNTWRKFKSGTNIHLDSRMKLKTKVTVTSYCFKAESQRRLLTWRDVSTCHITPTSTRAHGWTSLWTDLHINSIFTDRQRRPVNVQGDSSSCLLLRNARFK